MQRVLIVWIAFCSLALLCPPTGVAARQAQTETVIIQVNGQTPFGVSVIGTVVINRTCNGTETHSEASFNGMLNGAPVSFSGTAIERWLGNGVEEIEVVATDIQGPVLGSSPLRKILVAQTGPNTVTVDGVPAAIDHPLKQPCSGNATYTMTTVGKGSGQITTLPNTASNIISERSPFSFMPFVILGLLAAAGGVTWRIIKRIGGAA